MRNIVRLAALASAATLTALGGATGVVITTSTAAAASTGVHRQLAYHGTTNVRALSAAARINTPNSAGGGRYETPPAGVEAARPAPAVAAVRVPNPASTAITVRPGSAHGFVGITDEAQRLADNGNQYNLEPPDQGLCAHGGQLIEAVNNGLQVYSETGAAQSPVIGLNSFFHLPPEINRGFNPPTFGPFISDPRCYYDPQTARWFVTELEIDTNPYSGAFGYRSSELIAVSQTADPLGNYAIFSLDTTNDGQDGTSREANCPCFGDQPRIGADANGFYIATDSYPIHGSFNSNGGEIYAIGKRGLAAAANGSGSGVSVVAIHNGAVIIDGHPANAVQPATTPEGGTYAPRTEYFLSTPDFNGFATSGGVGASAVVQWTLSGTNTLNNASPSVTLTDRILPSEPYAPPVNAQQKPGPRPYGQSLKAPLAPLSVNDDRMQQVEYAAGRLYAALNTGVGPNGKANRSGIAWFVVTPHGSTGAVSGQGYVAAGGGTSLMYPAIGLLPGGSGVMTFSVSGPTYYPGQAFMRFTGTGPKGTVNLDKSGSAPEDGFTCYTAAGFGPACRWGDYSAASSDGAGNLVMATEIIPDTARNTVANWGTYVAVSRPGSGG